MAFINKIFGSHSSHELKRITPITQNVLDLEDTYKAMSEEELKAVTPALKEKLSNGAELDDILPDAFAAVREAADRVLGMRPFAMGHGLAYEEPQQTYVILNEKRGFIFYSPIFAD